jgi:membrane protein DedA with SNARE-associated domain
LELWNAAWPYVAIFATLFMTGIGLPPLPEELPIIGAGIAASKSELLWWIAWPASIAGVVAADIVLYWVGRLWGKRLFHWRWFKRVVPPERRRELETGFHKHGVKILLTGRLLPGVRTGVFLTAGAMRYPFLRFLLADSIYAVPGVGLIFFGSYFLTETFTRLIEDVDRVRHWLVLLALLAAAAFAAYRFYRFRKERVAANNFTPPDLPHIHLPSPSKIFHKTDSQHGAPKQETKPKPPVTG